MFSIYILECVNDKFYVGRTKYLQKRVEQHLLKAGAEWTKLYQPVKVIEVIDTLDTFDEDKYVLKYMNKYGIDNVRGGSFSTILLPEYQQKNIRKMLCNTDDRCFQCGKVGHFVKDCYKIKANNVFCERCKRRNHTIERCYARTDISGKPLAAMQSTNKLIDEVEREIEKSISDMKSDINKLNNMAEKLDINDDIVHVEGVNNEQINNKTRMENVHEDAKSINGNEKNVNGNEKNVNENEKNADLETITEPSGWYSYAKCIVQ